MEYFGYHEDKESWENWEQYKKESDRELLQDKVLNWKTMKLEDKEHD